MEESSTTKWKLPKGVESKPQKTSTGLSITKRGRLVFTIKLQEEMNAAPYERDIPIYVKVLLNEEQATQLYLQFFNESEKPKEAPYKLYKPNRKEAKIYSSHFEIARFLKMNNLIDEVKSAPQYLSGGPVEIIEKNIKQRYIIIDLKSRLINHE